jgi:hypothetical protein
VRFSRRIYSDQLLPGAGYGNFEFAQYNFQSKDYDELKELHLKLKFF